VTLLTKKEQEMQRKLQVVSVVFVCLLGILVSYAILSQGEWVTATLQVNESTATVSYEGSCLQYQQIFRKLFTYQEDMWIPLDWQECIHSPSSWHVPADFRAQNPDWGSFEWEVDFFWPYVFGAYPLGATKGSAMPEN
jgi:hypothetical protein